MKNSIYQTYYIIKTILDTSEIKDLEYNLVQTFINIFPNIKKEIEVIILNIIEDIIYPKIELFIYEIREKIINLFVELIEGENIKIKSKLTSQIYELIPKLDNSFKGIIENIFNENSNE